jgi:hypothetical protein
MHAINLEVVSNVQSCAAGFNADAYVFSFNMLTSASVQDHVQVLTIQKSTVIDENNATLTTFSTDLNNFGYPNVYGFETLTPTIMHGSTTGDPMWFVTEGPSDVNGNIDQMDLVKMTNILSNTPTFQDNLISVAPYSGGYNNVDGSSNILNVAMRDNILVADQTVNVGTDGQALAPLVPVQHRRRLSHAQPVRPNQSRRRH